MGSHAAPDVLRSPAAGGRVVRGSLWRATGSVAGIGAGLATASLMLRHLGVAGSGRYLAVLSLVAIGSSVVDVGLGMSASRELALRDAVGRRDLIADVLMQRLWTAPAALAAIAGFAFAAGYPAPMRVGCLLAGAGMCIMALADALLLPLTVQLRNARLALVDFAKQAVTLVCVALLVALGAGLEPFFAVLILAGVAIFALVPALAGRGAFVRPRLRLARQRELLAAALPLAVAIVLGQIYFRLVILLMSLISEARETGYFGGSLRATETLLGVPILVAGVALPVLAAAAHEDRARMRYAARRLTEGALIAGAFVVLCAMRAAEPVIAAIGGHDFAPAGAVLRIQVVGLLFGALVQIWAVCLVALGRRRQLILTNALGLLGLAVFAWALVPSFGARGGAVAGVLGDALLAALTWWRLHACGASVHVPAGFLARLAAASAAGTAMLALPGLPDLLDASLAAIAFLAVGQAIGLLPAELHDALRTPGPMRWQARKGVN